MVYNRVQQWQPQTKDDQPTTETFQSAPLQGIAEDDRDTSPLLDLATPHESRFQANLTTVSVQRKKTTRLEKRRPNRTGLPDNLKSGIEALSGLTIDHIKVHYNSAQPAQLKAFAYTQGHDIYVAPGKQQHLPHEAWHVVQQMQGRVAPIGQSQRGATNNDPALEDEADKMGAKALQIDQCGKISLKYHPYPRLIDTSYDANLIQCSSGKPDTSFEDKIKGTNTKNEVTQEETKAEEKGSTATRREVEKTETEAKVTTLLNEFSTLTSGYDQVRDNLTQRISSLPATVYIRDQDGSIRQTSNEKRIQAEAIISPLITTYKKVIKLRVKIRESLSTLQKVKEALANLSKNKQIIDTSARHNSLSETLIEKQKVKVKEATEKLQELLGNRKINIKSLKDDKVKAAYNALKKIEGVLKRFIEAREKKQAKKNRAETKDQKEKKLIKKAEEIDWAAKHKEYKTEEQEARKVNSGASALIEQLKQQSTKLGAQKRIQAELTQIMDNLDEQINEFLIFNGDPQRLNDNGTNDSRYSILRADAEAKLNQYYKMTQQEILEAFDANKEKVTKLGTAVADLPRLTPRIGEVQVYTNREIRTMTTQKSSLELSYKEATRAGHKEADRIRQQIRRQTDLIDAIKNTKGISDTAARLERLKGIQAEQSALDRQISKSPNLTGVIEGIMINKMKEMNRGYGNQIEWLLKSGRVLDGETLKRELFDPVKPDKYVSRVMELESLSADAKKGAYVQVGRMSRAALVEALEERNLEGAATQVKAAAAGSEFEADGISYWPGGEIEATQHKTTRAVRPLERRVHETQEITEPEFEKQLREAANQLSGLTAKGGVANREGREPETPPPGALRVANLRFQSVRTPGGQELQKYNEAIKAVLKERQRRDKKPRSHYVDRIILNFLDGKVIYNKGAGDFTYAFHSTQDRSGAGKGNLDVNS